MNHVSRYFEPALVERLNNLQLSARRLVEGSTSGLHKSPFKGASIEFRQHRFYVPGDELRRLDWRILARTDRLYVKEYDQETNLRCMLMIDASGSMSYGGAARTKFDFAARLVAALAYLMLSNTEHVGLAVFADSVRKWINPRSITGQMARIIETLERVTPGGPTRSAAPMHRMVQRLGRRALVVIVSDFLSPMETLRQGLAHVVHEGNEVIALRVLDRDEVEFPFRSWTQFRGIEGESARLCEPAMIRKTYLDNFHRHERELRDLCRSLRIELANFVTDEPLVDAVTRFLRYRK